jgi:hypothetical protein
VRYGYLWLAEFLRGQEEGVKDRPCAVVMVITDDDGKQVVTVLPVTHSPPADPASAVEIPAGTKQRLGLDDDRSWIVLTEANRFTWPGPDLRLDAGADAASVGYGLLPRALYSQIRDRFAAAISARLARVVSRTE